MLGIWKVLQDPELMAAYISAPLATEVKVAAAGPCRS